MVQNHLYDSLHCDQETGIVPLTQRPQLAGLTCCITTSVIYFQNTARVSAYPGSILPLVAPRSIAAKAKGFLVAQ